ncbi:Cycloeucalenol cycloisomerase [Acorus gramineus]|uniref:Cycloeucalenol cycloisomerase n=1 Tax=Acorus gramineus TaxID=55184 RepID=A0AAV9AQ63_ACOGR|nr:Cycloeucalenol cycloisomerase [Acorus gramineus]
MGFLGFSGGGGGGGGGGRGGSGREVAAKRFSELEYLLLGLVSAVPTFVVPLLVVGKDDSSRQWKDRYWVKVPHTTFLLTHVCFQFYHVASNMTLRRLRHSVAGLPQPIQLVTEAAWILALSYFIAWLETIAIANFPYYSFVDRDSMYKVGSLFYAIYFFVSFPMFLRIDEKPGNPWDLPRVAIDALGAAMLVTIILDLWRLFLGPIVPVLQSKQCTQPGLAWYLMFNKSGSGCGSGAVHGVPTEWEFCLVGEKVKVDLGSLQAGGGGSDHKAKPVGRCFTCGGEGGGTRWREGIIPVEGGLADVSGVLARVIGVGIVGTWWCVGSAGGRATRQ